MFVSSDTVLHCLLRATDRALTQPLFQPINNLDSFYCSDYFTTYTVMMQNTISIPVCPWATKPRTIFCNLPSESTNIHNNNEKDHLWLRQHKRLADVLQLGACWLIVFVLCPPQLHRGPSDPLRGMTKILCSFIQWEHARTHTHTDTHSLISTVGLSSPSTPAPGLLGHHYSSPD